jgi:hypothetical protein
VGDVPATIDITSAADAVLNYSELLYYNVYVEEEIPTDFISDEEFQATFYKETLVGNLTNILSTTDNRSLIYFNKISESVKLRQGSVLYIYILGQKYISEIDGILEKNQYRVKKVEGSTTPYISQMPSRATLNLLAPREDILITITAEHASLEDIIPLGDFTVDNFTQCQAYMTSLHNLDEDTSKVSNIPELPDSIETNMYQEIKKGVSSIEVYNTQGIFKGLYNEVYPS